MFLSLYFSSLVGFVSNHPVAYCILLLSGALGVSGYLYTVLGMSWYLVLFCLVYVGGIYVLFIFVSVHLSNPMAVSGGSGFALSGVFVTFCFFNGVVESGVDGFVSVVIICVLTLSGFPTAFLSDSDGGFMGVSVVSGEKDSFFR
uniref:NADH dehydrogenase subunit 6 n=1 Tax=Paragonimus westermani TaxID=34504 RepID=A0A1P8P0J4_9TREM|nr:NADH dehydrogenase subunit 6 [Paragonimus westermani]